MKENISKIIIILSDIVSIFISIVIAVTIRKVFNVFLNVPEIDYSYVSFWWVYILYISLLLYSGVYYKRFDFWHESKIIVKVSFGVFLILFAALALGQNIQYYSRTTLFLIFLVSALFLPINKFFVKRILFKLNFWQKKAIVISENLEFKNQLFDDPYLGYVKTSDLQVGTIFIDGQSIGKEKLNKIIEKNIKNIREVVFTPVLSGYDFSNSHIYNIFNSRKNIFSLENKLLFRRNIFFKALLDYMFVLLSAPIWLTVLFIVAAIIKIEDPSGRVLFRQERLGKDGRIFTCYKFRSMYTDQSFMKEWLDNNPDEKKYYAKYHKYINDPRITKIGNILRKTSLDELPQLINVLKGEMSLVGPRPYMVKEKEDIGQKAHLVFAIKPGITGMWQVSGRSNIDFNTRVEMDVWYVKNWSLWNDIVILLKTIGSVLGRGGAC
ncbi:sugar transferase [Rodentibacter caecimuris]|uniref:sugar transferase n=1 Tax=Rodentibacter caecimuris TaxID=1796644 RepID=UPI0013A09D6A|nr:sugar transferase [Rodentibacter heylii]QIA77857.1 UDP-phosphate galactose phosphotransferase [Rodentibacter heylii]